jgi:hypothetical protein
MLRASLCFTIKSLMLTELGSLERPNAMEWRKPTVHQVDVVPVFIEYFKSAYLNSVTSRTSCVATYFS